MDNCIEFLKKYNIPKNDYIVVGSSGGPDSMFLLNLLYNNDYNVICAHVNHNIRKESAKEEKFLKDYCKKLDIIFECLELEKDGKHNEAYYRKKRYTFYKDIADKYSTKYIMTAHHGDDLIETILMRITRGSNLKGYMGFPKIYNEKEYIFIKPLIFMTKKEILDYDDDNAIPYVLDSTNDLDDYMRNRFRHHILPELKKENAHVHMKFLKYSEEIEGALNYIDSIVKEYTRENYNGTYIDLAKFLKLDEYIQKKELEDILSKTYKDSIDKIKSLHVKNILNELKKGKNFKLNLPEGIIVKREYEKLYIAHKVDTVSYNIKLDKMCILNDGSTIEVVDSSDEENNFVTRLDSSDLSMPLFVRTKLDGDKIEIKNLNGSKKIKSIFIDEKISPTDREAWPVVVDSENRVVWLPGLRKSKFDNKKDEKYDIILKYTRKEKFNEEK